MTNDELNELKSLAFTIDKLECSDNMLVKSAPKLAVGVLKLIKVIETAHERVESLERRCIDFLRLQPEEK